MQEGKYRDVLDELWLRLLAKQNLAWSENTRTSFENTHRELPYAHLIFQSRNGLYSERRRAQAGARTVDPKVASSPNLVFLGMTQGEISRADKIK